MKEATITLSNWDTETEHGVRIIDDTEQKQVILMCMTPFQMISNWLNDVIGLFFGGNYLPFTQRVTM